MPKMMLVIPLSSRWVHQVMSEISQQKGPVPLFAPAVPSVWILPASFCHRSF